MDALTLTIEEIARSLATLGPTRRSAFRLLGGIVVAGLVRGEGATAGRSNRKRRGKQRCRGRQQKCGKRCCTRSQTCRRKRCLTCDVCARGCRFTTVQATVNTAADGATIRICAGTYRGMTSLGQNVSLIGAGSNRTTLHGNNATSTVVVAPGAFAGIRGLTITGGNTGFGGGIDNAGTLTLSNCRVSGNTAQSSGGGIVTTGTLIVTDSQVTDNTAVSGSGGGIFIFAGGTATVEPGSVRGNTPDQCAGPGSFTGC